MVIFQSRNLSKCNNLSVLVNELQHGEGHVLDPAGHDLGLGRHVPGLGGDGGGADQDGKNLS